MIVVKSRQLFISAVLISIVWLFPGQVSAAPYGGDVYGDCIYSEGCASPVIIPSSEDDDNNSGSSNKVERDIDGDNDQESAINSNGDESDGFEDFNDPDGSSHVIRKIDGDDDQKIDFFISTDEDSLPEVYWDPDDDILSTVQFVNCDDDEEAEWRFYNGSEYLIYDPSTGVLSRTCTSSSIPGDKSQQENSTTNLITGNIPLFTKNKLYQSIGQLFDKSSSITAYSFPYFLLALIFLLAMRLIWQARNELKRSQHIARTRKAENLLIMEKQNFMMLSAHYLRTPMTVIQGYLEQMNNPNTVSKETVVSMQQSAMTLSGQISDLMQKVQQDSKLQHILPTENTAERKLSLSFLTVLPLIVLIVLLVVGQFIFIDFRIVNPNILNLITQLILLILLSQLVIGSMRKRQINRLNRIEEEYLLENQRELDVAKSRFIKQTVDSLDNTVKNLTAQLPNLDKNSDSANIDSSLSQLSKLLNKFKLATYLNGLTRKAEKQIFTLADIINQSIQANQQLANNKSIIIESDAKQESIIQQQRLIELILRSFIENAIIASREGSKILVKSKIQNNKVIFSVTDNGKGISEAQQELLFQPFSKVESAQEFNSPGLGFSLYLDRLIAKYLGGEINIESQANQGTTVSLAVTSST